MIENEFKLYLDTLHSIKNKLSKEPNYLFTASSLDQNDLKLNTIFNAESINLNNQNFVGTQDSSIGWITGSQVCFCAEAFPSVDSKHEDAPALTILGTVLRNGYLHSAIREKGGAYGSGAHKTQIIKYLNFSHTETQSALKHLKNFKSRELGL